MRTRASEQSRSQVNARCERSRVGVSVCMIWRMCLSRSGVFVCVDCLEISSVQFDMNVYIECKEPRITMPRLNSRD